MGDAITQDRCRCGLSVDRASGQTKEPTAQDVNPAKNLG
jgi:hypothetical protein